MPDNEQPSAPIAPSSIAGALSEIARAVLADLAKLAPNLHAAHDAGNDLPVLEIDDDGWMRGLECETYPSVRCAKLATAVQPNGDHHVEGLVWHWTDTRNAGAANLARRIVGPVDPAHARSCHAWIDRTGKIAQSVSFERASWHAGSNTARRFQRGGDGLWHPAASGYGANLIFGGIEIENVGDLRLVNGKWLGWPFRFGTADAPVVVPVDEVAVNPRCAAQGWHAFTLEQEHAAERIVRALHNRYGLVRASFEWGHIQIDPERRTDPGPIWMGSIDGEVPAQGAPGGHLRAILDRVFAAT